MLAANAWQALFGMPQIAIVATFGVGGLVAIVGVIAYFWHETQKARSTNQLKRKLVEKGLSVEEIERVVAAQAPAGGKSRS